MGDPSPEDTKLFSSEALEDTIYAVDMLGGMLGHDGSVMGFLHGRMRLDLLDRNDFGMDEIGHFGLFHERHCDGFWTQSLRWLQNGQNPWRFAEIPPLSALEPWDQ